ncbi:hypothetical protein IEQ34_006715 [Dendrobium chrysotoxum]|uniref:Thioredoxin domain-containing protein n=1 Tax=Dendrobium chrysotoxum TaxID=161865 RepID=A0AAV7H796_DENCH|nr:hypothetical protein IEQ34_006715 [Dendrobium chrysotoxum]
MFDTPIWQVNGDTLDKELAHAQDGTYHSVFLYASWRPFSQKCRSIFDTLGSMFQQIRHLAVEQYSAMPSVFSRYGIHDFPAFVLTSRTASVRYHGLKDLDSSVNFYRELTGEWLDTCQLEGAAALSLVSLKQVSSGPGKALDKAREGGGPPELNSIHSSRRWPLPRSGFCGKITGSLVSSSVSSIGHGEAQFARVAQVGPNLDGANMKNKKIMKKPRSESSISSLPPELLEGILLEALAASPTPIRDIRYFRQTCKNFHATCSSKRVGKYMNVEDWSMYWHDKQGYLGFLQSCAESENVNALFLFGLVSNYFLLNLIKLYDSLLIISLGIIFSEWVLRWKGHLLFSVALWHQLVMERLVIAAARCFNVHYRFGLFVSLLVATLCIVLGDTSSCGLSCESPWVLSDDPLDMTYFVSCLLDLRLNIVGSGIVCGYSLLGYGHLWLQEAEKIYGELSYFSAWLFMGC